MQVWVLRYLFLLIVVVRRVFVPHYFVLHTLDSLHLTAPMWQLPFALPPPVIVLCACVEVSLNNQVRESKFVPRQWMVKIFTKTFSDYKRGQALGCQITELIHRRLWSDSRELEVFNYKLTAQHVPQISFKMLEQPGDKRPLQFGRTMLNVVRSQP